MWLYCLCWSLEKIENFRKLSENFNSLYGDPIMNSCIKKQVLHVHFLYFFRRWVPGLSIPVKRLCIISDECSCVLLIIRITTTTAVTWHKVTIRNRSMNIYCFAVVSSKQWTLWPKMLNMGFPKWYICCDWLYIWKILYTALWKSPWNFLNRIELSQNHKGCQKDIISKLNWQSIIKDHWIFKKISRICMHASSVCNF